MLSYLTDPSGVLVLLVWGITAALVLNDISKYSDKAWSKVEESRLVWQVIGTALAWPVGTAVYFFALRPRLQALVEDDRKEIWMKEYAERQAAATQGTSATDGDPTSPSDDPVSPQLQTPSDDASSDYPPSGYSSGVSTSQEHSAAWKGPETYDPPKSD